MARRVKSPGGKPPVFNPPKPPRFKTIIVGGKRKTAKVTGKGARGIGLGLHGKGRSITAKGYSGAGAYGYGQGNHGVVPHSKPAAHAAGTRRHPGGGAQPTPTHPVSGGNPPRHRAPSSPTPTKRPPKPPSRHPKAGGGRPPKKSPGPGPVLGGTNKPSGPRKSRKINKRK